MTSLSISRILRLDIKAAKVEGYDVVRTILAVVLLTAAALKGHQLATEPVANNSLLTSRWFLILEVEFELAFGLALFSGLYKRLLWLAAVGCFGLFSLVTLYKGLAGHASCGCFGKVEVSPWYTLIFDVCALAALLRFRPNGHASRSVRSPHLRLATVAALIIAVGLPTTYAMASYTPTTVSPDGDLIGDSSFVILEPETWIGKPFPLLKYIDIGDQLAKGKWIVVLYHYDCRDCREAIPKYERMAREFAGQPDRLRIALVEIPPYTEVSGSLISTDSTCLRGRLSNVKEWFAKTPVVVGLTKGNVRFSTPSPVNPLLFVNDVVEAGRVYEGQVIHASFPFKNMGKQDIRVSKVIGNCSCVLSDYPQAEIKPHCTGIISTSIDTKGKIGNIREKMLVHYDDGIHEFRRLLELKAIVLVDGKLVSYPHSVHVGTVAAKTNFDRSLTIRQLGDRRSVNILNIDTPSWINITSLKEDDKKDQWCLKINLITPDATGQLKDTITVHTDHHNFPTLDIPIIGFVEGRVVATPRNIVAFLDCSKKDNSVSVVIRNKDNHTLKIKSISFQNHGEGYCDIHFDETGKLWEQTVILSPQRKMFDRNTWSDVMLITVTTDGTNEIVQVPVLFAATATAPFSQVK